jgi:hypothetical protein
MCQHWQMAQRPCCLITCAFGDLFAIIFGEADPPAPESKELASCLASSRLTNCCNLLTYPLTASAEDTAWAAALASACFWAPALVSASPVLASVSPALVLGWFHPRNCRLR